MDSVVVACFDVYYYENYANASCIVFKRDKQDFILSEYNEIINNINEYIPGQFYKRELPCILQLFDKVLEARYLLSEWPKHFIKIAQIILKYIGEEAVNHYMLALSVWSLIMLLSL